MPDRKSDHIQLAFKSQTNPIEIDERFIYEPLLSAHPEGLAPIEFAGKDIRTPIWASSMTGGTKLAKKINENIAKVCKDFGMGMGLGSCRMLLESDEYLEDFNVRKYIGEEQPLFANLGIAQVEILLEQKGTDKIRRLINKLEADGLIIHVNPLQEWFQPEGNRIKRSPAEILEEFIEQVDCQLIVKEVGQGMGSKSLKRLLQLPVTGIEFGAFGGTNFSLLELLRANKEELEIFKPFANVGQTAEQMVNAINQIAGTVDITGKQLIISGGVKNFLDGYYLTRKCAIQSLYGQASGILKYAQEGYEKLHNYIEKQSKGLALAEAYLRINPAYL